MRTALAVVLLALLAAALPASAQPADAGPIVRIELTDGTVLVGTIEGEDAAEVVLRTTGGATVTVATEQIRRRSAFEGRIQDGRVMRDDPNRSRLFFAPTARALGDGRGYFAAYEVFFPFVAYGVGDATLAGGVSLVPGSPVQIAYAAPKYTFYETEGAAVAVGGIINTPINFGRDDDIDFGAFGLLFGLGTLGSARQSVTGGVGFGFSLGGGDATLSGHPVIMLGGEHQISGSVKLISENYVITYREGGHLTCNPTTGACTTTPGGLDSIILFSGGVRFFGERLAADFALFSSPELIGEGGFPFIPWIGFSYNFGR